MSKLSFRARALDASKLMPIYKAEEIPELPDFAAINRAVPQMPTGMEKEEESEHHLQRALSAQQVYGTAEALVIPIPQMEDVAERYHELYSAKGDFKPPKQFIHVQPWGMDQEIPDYDMDSEDETWLNKQAKNLKMEVTSLKFENMMDRLEKGSGQTVVTLNEAKALLKEDDDLTIAVYDYWLNKRLRLQHALIPQVKTEKRDGSTTNNPYVAFRRRTEKMQTRKNRKNDETSYEKMLKLRRDLKKALTILEIIKRRDKSKKELLQLTIEIVEKRCQMQDWEGKALVEALAQRHKLHSFLPLQSQIPMGREWGRQDDNGVYVKKKREYKKRKHKLASTSHTVVTTQQPAVQLPHYNEGEMMQADGYSTEEEGGISPSFSTSDHETDDDPDGIFAFRRKAGCVYHAPINEGYGNWPWHGKDEGGSQEQHFRYSLGSISQPRHCVGYVRRRVGRGGRVLLDRAHSVWDDYLKELDLGAVNDADTNTGWTAEYINYIKDNNIPHFRPKTPPTDEQISSAGIHPAFRDSLSPMLGQEFNAELFHTHQEQLLKMQRQQQEQLLHQDTTDIGSFVDLEHSFSPPPSRFTLDSATALFAASAVCNSASELKDTSPTGNLLGTSIMPMCDSPIPTPHSGATISSMSLPADISGLGSGDTLVNGPSKLECKSGGFSTSPAANVLQLNFPMTSLTKKIEPPSPPPSPKESVAPPSPTPASSSTLNNLKSSTSITSVGYSAASNSPVSPAIATPFAIVTQVSMTPSIATKAVTPTAPAVLKLASTPMARNDSIPRENHETVNNVTNVTAMEVT